VKPESLQIKSLLTEGLNILRQNDETIENLIKPRSDEVISLLERYIQEIELFNSAYGLVAVENSRELVIKHILDSLAPLGMIARITSDFSNSIPNNKHNGSPQIADAGSGAGLPGIPLAIALPDCNFTLIERMGRRAGFLFNTGAVLKLANITVEEREIEKTQKERFSLVTFRAFKPMDLKLLKTLFNTLTENGKIAAYKGRREKIEAEMAPLENYCHWEALSCPVPFLDEKRHLLIVEKKLDKEGSISPGNPAQLSLT
jgi:16S rRNA (guanine527-N7)-methyltransferase